jgi:hypothetical protein
LLATRDIMQISNITDPKSGQDWYTAARALENLRVNKTPIANIPNLPFFENLYAPGSLSASILFGRPMTNTQAAYASCLPTRPSRPWRLRIGVMIGLPGSTRRVFR